MSVLVSAYSQLLPHVACSVDDNACARIAVAMTASARQSCVPDRHPVHRRPADLSCVGGRGNIGVAGGGSGAVKNSPC
ncbi:MAG: hypothetical protein QOE94_1291 [Mycobacterium sp.]|jgi:hypothetical protein|nr:hypothetical protein [Mycobacterium sp.]